MTDRDLAELFEPYVWRWFSSTFEHPTPPQVESWPRIAEGNNTLVFSPTGSGKTLSAFLWCLNELYREGRAQGLDDTVYVLYVSPLKALNNDIQKNLLRPLAGIPATAAEMGYEVPEVRSAVRTGDTTQRQRSKMARRPPHILITTPESLFIILATERFREALRSVRYVIVDEIHAMSDNKRGVHLALSLERLEHLVRTTPNEGEPEGRTPTGSGGFVRIGLSATQNPLDEIARFLVGAGEDGQQRPCEIVDVGGRKDLDVRVVAPVDNLLEAHFDAIWGSAYDAMLQMVRAHRTTLIFTNSRYKTERTALRLRELAAEDGRVAGRFAPRQYGQACAAEHGEPAQARRPGRAGGNVVLGVRDRRGHHRPRLSGAVAQVGLQRHAADRALGAPARRDQQGPPARHRSRRLGGVDRAGPRDP